MSAMFGPYTYNFVISDILRCLLASLWRSLSTSFVNISMVWGSSAIFGRLVLPLLTWLADILVRPLAVFFVRQAFLKSNSVVFTHPGCKNEIHFVLLSTWDFASYQQKGPTSDVQMVGEHPRKLALGCPELSAPVYHVFYQLCNRKTSSKCGNCHFKVTVWRCSAENTYVRRR